MNKLIFGLLFNMHCGWTKFFLQGVDFKNIQGRIKFPKSLLISNYGDKYAPF